MTPAGTSNELDVQNGWEENTHTHCRSLWADESRQIYCQGLSGDANHPYFLGGSLARVGREVRSLWLVCARRTIRGLKLERYEVKHNVTSGDDRRTAISNSNESSITVIDATLPQVAQQFQLSGTVVVVWRILPREIRVLDFLILLSSPKWSSK